MDKNLKSKKQKTNLLVLYMQELLVMDVINTQSQVLDINAALVLILISVNHVNKTKNMNIVSSKLDNQIYMLDLVSEDGEDSMDIIINNLLNKKEDLITGLIKVPLLIMDIIVDHMALMEKKEDASLELFL